LAVGEPVELKIDVEGALPGEVFYSKFNPAAFCGGAAPKLKRPYFLGIVASSTLAITLARKSSGAVDGLVVEGETAGGHNAPPRGVRELSADGEPIYGPRDQVDLAKIRELGLPFWLAGSYGQAGKLAAAQQLGAVGIQVGTAFAFCAESGIRSDLKQLTLQMSRDGTARVFTDPLASPTGFPFKVVQLPGTQSQARMQEERTRQCDLGYLRHAFRRPDGQIGYRCPAEPVEDYIHKGGLPADTKGRVCLCNGLVATIGLAQVRAQPGPDEALVTAGNEVGNVAAFLRPGHDSYSAAEVIRQLQSRGD